MIVEDTKKALLHFLATEKTTIYAFCKKNEIEQSTLSRFLNGSTKNPSCNFLQKIIKGIDKKVKITD